MTCQRSRCSSPFVRLGPDVFELLLAHLCGEPLNGAISTDAYRRLLPFAICCTHQYRLTRAAVNGLSLLPLRFTQRPAARPALPVPPFPVALYSFYSPAYRHYTNSSSCSAVVFRNPHRGSASLLDLHLPRALATFPNLRSLHVYRTTRLSDHGFETLILSLPALRELVVNANRHLTIDAIRRLPACKQLHTLQLSYCTGLGDDACAEAAQIISGIASLRTLSVAYWNITDAFVERIAHLPNLSSLDLSLCKRLTSRSCMHLASYAPNLHTFKMRCSPHLTDCGVRALAECSNLHFLNLSLCRRISDDALQLMADARKMPHLHTVLLSQCQALTDTAVTFLSSNRNIRRLDLSYCEALTDHIAYSLSTMYNLQDIDLSGCSGITDNVVMALLNCKSLTNISVAFCLGLTDHSANALCSAARTAPYNMVDVRKCVQISMAALSSLSAKCVTLRSALHNQITLSTCP
ncbi:unnamed protein product [Agarophyton chilense]